MVRFYSDSGFLTASHCDGGALGSGTTGDSIYQNVVGTGKLIGTVSINPQWNSTDPGCMLSLCTDADAMYVHTTTATDSLHWIQQWFSTSTWTTGSDKPASLTINGQWRSDTVNTLVFDGATLYKVGRTTGVTYGVVTATCAAYVIGTYAEPCADEVDSATVGAGDSGAPVFYPSDTSVTPHEGPYLFGILFASDSPMSLPYCTSSCEFLFTEWSNIESWMNRYFLP